LGSRCCGSFNNRGGKLVVVVVVVVTTVVCVAGPNEKWPREKPGDDVCSDSDCLSEEGGRNVESASMSDESVAVNRLDVCDVKEACGVWKSASCCVPCPSCKHDCTRDIING